MFIIHTNFSKTLNTQWNVFFPLGLPTQWSIMNNFSIIQKLIWRRRHTHNHVYIFFYFIFCSHSAKNKPYWPVINSTKSLTNPNDPKMYHLHIFSTRHDCHSELQIHNITFHICSMYSFLMPFLSLHLFCFSFLSSAKYFKFVLLVFFRIFSLYSLCYRRESSLCHSSFFLDLCLHSGKVIKFILFWLLQ